MARLPLVDVEKVTDPEILGIFAWVTEMEGKVPNHFAIELNFPELMKSKLGFTKTLWETGELSMEEIQHVGHRCVTSERMPILYWRFLYDTGSRAR